MVKSNDFKEISPCFGDYENDIDKDRDGYLMCNGDPSATDVYNKSVCPYRDFCYAFKLNLKETGSVLNDYLEFKQIEIDGEEYDFLSLKDSENEKFFKFLKKLIKKYKIKDGKITIINKIQKKQIKKSKRSSMRKKVLTRIFKAKANEKFKILKQNYEDFKQDLLKFLLNYEFVKNNEAPIPGKLYEINRLKKTKYISIYCCSKFKDVPLVSCFFKPRSLTINVRVACDIDDFNNNITLSALDILKPIKNNYNLNSKFVTICKNLDKAGLSLLAENLALLIKKEVIKLPIID